MHASPTLQGKSLAEGVTTRSGSKVAPPNEREGMPSEGEGSVAPTAGTKTQLGPHLPDLGDKKRVTFNREEKIVEGNGQVTLRRNPCVDEFGNELGPMGEGVRNPLPLHLTLNRTPFGREVGLKHTRNVLF